MIITKPQMLLLIILISSLIGCSHAAPVRYCPRPVKPVIQAVNSDRDVLNALNQCAGHVKALEATIQCYEKE